MSSLATDRRSAAGLGVLSLFVLGVAAWLVGTAVLPGLVPGWRSVVVTSGSMEPGISPGDVVLVAPEGPGIEVGTVVLFSTPEGPVTHRVVGVNADGTYATKGDANPAPDSTPLRGDHVLGRARVVVPNAGLPTLWWARRDLAPLLATLLLLAVAAGALAVALDAWRLDAAIAAARHRGAAVVPTVATLAVCLGLVATSSSTSTARAAFLGRGSNGASTFTAWNVDRYRFLSDGAGDRPRNPYLWLSSPSATATNASLPNYDTDRNTDPGLTLQPSPNGLAETNANSLQYWYQAVPAAGVRFNGPTKVRLWSAMRNFDTTRRGELVVGVYDCVAWPITCTVVGTGDLDDAPWNPTATWREAVVDLGSISYVVPSGHFLAVKVVVGANAGSAMWLAYDTSTMPSALEVTP